MNIYCPVCKIKPNCLVDKIYLETNDNCWECDKNLWQKEKLSLKEFERREILAMDIAVIRFNEKNINEKY